MKSSRKLIVNADDCNLTEGVTEAICQAHQKGIVSSTTLIVNLPISRLTLRKLAKQTNLGIGLHLNISLGRPVSNPRDVQSLLNEKGSFLREPLPLCGTRIKSQVIDQEYRTQINRFKKVFGVLPTHLDTHHQLHDSPFIFRVLASLAKEFNLPVRRSSLMHLRERMSMRLGLTNIKTSNDLCGSLNVQEYWRAKTLKKTLKELGCGVTEIMCHPGYVDEDLRSISSFREGRQKEYSLFADQKWRHFLEVENIELTHYGICYT